MRYRLFLIVFITAKSIALLSSENDNKEDNNNKKVFLNKFITTSKNKDVKKYVFNVSKMLWQDTFPISSSNSIIILRSGDMLYVNFFHL